jgi:formylglycine-generating enzyme required for sulfatase activity
MTLLLDHQNANSTCRGFLKTTAAMTLGSAALAGVADLDGNIWEWTATCTSKDLEQIPQKLKTFATRICSKLLIWCDSFSAS